MIQFDADFFDGKTSMAHPVTVVFDGVTLTAGNEMAGTGIRAFVRDCSIEAALGRTRRSIFLPGGELLQTNDGSAVRALEQTLGTNRHWNLVHFLESHWRAVACCMVCLAAALFALVYYAIPHLSNRVASAIPPEVTVSVSKNTLDMFDRHLLEPTQLEIERQQETMQLFMDTVRRIDPQWTHSYTIEFRSGGRLGANAFALPSGIVIVTDELVSLSGDDDELSAIFAHEIAHVKMRHAVRHILQSTGILFLVSLLTGDITSVTNFAAFLPTLLIESGYSRDFEREADHAAGSMLIARGKGTAPFRSMLEKLDASNPEALKLGVFSTHPETMRRIEDLRELERTSGSAAKR